MVRRLLTVKIRSVQGNKCYQTVVIALVIKMLCAHEMARSFSLEQSCVTLVWRQSSLKDVKNLQCKPLQSAHFLCSLCRLLHDSHSHNSQPLHNIKLWLLVFFYLLFNWSGKPEFLTSYLFCSQASYGICCLHNRIWEICQIFKCFTLKNHFMYHLSRYHICCHFTFFWTLSKISPEFTIFCSPLYVLNNRCKSKWENFKMDKLVFLVLSNKMDSTMGLCFFLAALKESCVNSHLSSLVCMNEFIFKIFLMSLVINMFIDKKKKAPDEDWVRLCSLG